MSVKIFQKNIRYIVSFTKKLKRENIKASDQKILIKSYAYNLNINLTNKMIEELLVC